jgi:hypothetical protein
VKLTGDANPTHPSMHASRRHMAGIARLSEPGSMPVISVAAMWEE